MTQPAADPAGPMRKRVLGGLAWTGGSQVVMQVVRLFTAVALARLLAPDDYGLAALALVFASLVLVLDLALGAAVIQRKNLTEDDRATAFWMSIGAGVVFTALGVVLSGPIAALFGQPEVGPLCAALSLSFLITSLATTHEALLLRDMQFCEARAAHDAGHAGWAPWPESWWGSKRATLGRSSPSSWRRPPSRRFCSGPCPRGGPACARGRA